jgi:hypothetical protein
MNEHDIRVQVHQILDAHAMVLVSIRTAHALMQQAFEAHDAALVSAIDANRAALELLNRLIDEGVSE